MFDAYGRNIHYLRLSVTDLCNLRCRYCMPDGVPKLAHEDILTYEEFLRLAALFAQCGIDTVRITGGEPLVRRGVEQLTAGLKAIPGIRRVALTTNGVLLAQKLPALLAAGLAIQLFVIRCPECGAHLPLFPGEYCKYCGNRLDWDKPLRR